MLNYIIWLKLDSSSTRSGPKKIIIINAGYVLIADLTYISHTYYIDGVVASIKIYQVIAEGSNPTGGVFIFSKSRYFWDKASTNRSRICFRSKSAHIWTKTTSTVKIKNEKTRIPDSKIFWVPAPWFWSIHLICFSNFSVEEVKEEIAKGLFHFCDPESNLSFESNLIPHLEIYLNLWPLFGRL